MARLVIDTSVLISIARQQIDIEKVVSPSDDLLLPTVVIAEFLTGIELMKSAKSKIRQIQFLTHFKALAEVLEFTESEARAFAVLEASAVRAGTPISEFDLVIAAHATVESALLLTSDKKSRFAELPGVIARVV
ncbi:type II toxin-antitoxin system VapC family toxin [Rhodoluna limnophila]|uniref:type II toxin-antitoxin system VapC family toxin n=1 Tax=Rhodoluna limnophila TaxID=232537 RepID=UPI001105D886|nr:PIN domain-containing protein [Rhodoluna limnophila]